MVSSDFILVIHHKETNQSIKDEKGCEYKNKRQ